MPFGFDLGDVISDLGKSLAGSSGDNAIGGLIGNVISVAGSDGWDGIVNQITNSNSPIINQAVGVLRDNVGDEWDPFINGVKGLADGDPNAVAGAAIGGLRDWAGPERFDEIAVDVGQVINGDPSGAANALFGEVAEAVGNDTFTAIVQGANDLGFTKLGDAVVGEAVGELRELVGESTWTTIDLAADVHADMVDGEQADESTLSDDPVDGLIDPFDDAEIGDDSTAGAERPLSEDPEEGLIDPFDGDGEIGGGAAGQTPPPSPFGDTPLEDILEPSPINPDAPFEPSSPFGDTPLEDILEPSDPIVMAPNTGIAPEHLVGASGTPEAIAGMDGAALDDAVGDFQMGTGFPGGAPLPQTREFIPLETEAAPVVETGPVAAPMAEPVGVVAEPVTALAADVATADSYTAQVDSFFDSVDGGVDSGVDSGLGAVDPAADVELA
ncbi:MAG: hypothetical protein AAGA93_23025 [Actinomycetota bacterium]